MDKTQMVKKTNKPEVDYTNTCSVCNEKYNKSTHKKITCYCNLELCIKCMKTYILSKYQIPHCFNCNIEWTREFIIKNTTNVWFNGEYTLHYKNILFKNEEDQFKDTVVYIEERKIKERETNKIRIEINKYNQLLKPLYDQINEYNEIIRNLHTDINNIHSRTNNVKRKEFVCKCPNNDCIGYLSSAHKCDLCNNWFCPDCNELKGGDKNAEHICNPDTVETVKLLHKECKNCPKCVSKIYKIDGCDMMWCVSCHTSFSWRTLNILNNKNIHNPHYFEWLRTQTPDNREMERNPNDILCGREIDNHFIVQFLRKIKNVFNIKWEIVYYNEYYPHELKHEVVLEYNKLPDINKTYNNIYVRFGRILRSIIHIRDIDINGRFSNNRNDNDSETVKRELRIQFMENKIKEHEFKTNLLKRNKQIDKNNAFSTLLLMYANCMTDILYRMHDNLSNNNINEYLTEVDELRKYVDIQLKTISKLYGCVCYKIDYTREWLIKSNI
jgi:hypothetical protein